MGYAVKELFYTLQGEGAQAGRAAVFCRFTGCNLWSGREADRKKASCTFCDTDFVGVDGPGGGRFKTADDLATRIFETWKGHPAGAKPYVVFTGGEPSLQLDDALVDACHGRGFEVAIETNGTRALPLGIDWVCVSPKPNSTIVVTMGDELKFVYPQDALQPEQFVDFEFTHWFIQPMDGPRLGPNTAQSVAYCRDNPRWRLSLQTHKLVGIP